LDAHIGQDSVERPGELAGPVSDEEPEVGDVIAEIHHEVADLLGGPSPIRVGGSCPAGAPIGEAPPQRRTHKSFGAETLIKDMAK
jgi:hypothetical protein